MEEDRTLTDMLQKVLRAAPDPVELVLPSASYRFSIAARA